MRIVIDSSMLIAAIARPGVCTELLDEVARDHTLVLLDYILGEIERTLHEKFDVPAKAAARLAQAIGRGGFSKTFLPESTPSFRDATLAFFRPATGGSEDECRRCC